jgi:hypothetical protein
VFGPDWWDANRRLVELQVRTERMNMCLNTNIMFWYTYIELHMYKYNIVLSENCYWYLLEVSLSTDVIIDISWQPYNN